ncbi:MAG TPA: phosphodiester glycosidase family protein, partial [Candidatus Acidoferrales bacterium]|nr:phosphodiester glycosidase family protein [Candidatus Acidoferrales bacterium]
AITADHQTIFANFRYTGELSDDDGRTWSLTGMNVWPPQGGVALLSDVLGTLPPQPDTVLVPVTQISADRYQVLDAAAAATQPQTVPLAFAFGPAALQQNTPPAVGDMLTVSAQIEPPLSGIVSAIGGGPLLVHDGALCDDPLPPAPGEALVAVPLSGALRQRDGTLLLVEVDGRAPMVSVGLTRPAFAALLLAFGAVDGMAFDGGGSSTLVARLPGDTLATLQNTPSDGHERDVSDGIFVYDDTPVGPPARLALRHFPRRMFEGARAPLEVVVTDAAGHVLDDASPAPVQVTLLPATMGHVDTNGDLVADAPALAGTLHVDRGPLSLDTPLTVLDHLATLRIEPPSPNPAPGKTIALRAVAFDASGAPIDVDGSVQWSAPGASIRADGVYHAGTQDGSVVAQVAGQQVATLVRVGQRDLPIDVFRQDAADARAWSFTSLPVAQPGAVEIDDDDALALSYDFTGSERAAYADADIKIAGDLLALSLDVQGDGSGAALRVAVTTADGDRLPITLAAHVDWQGWRRLTVRMPHEAVSPLTLDGFYLVASPSGPEPPPPGAIALRNLHGIFAGTSTPNPPYRLE